MLCLRKVTVRLECFWLSISDYFTGCYRLLHVIYKGELCAVFLIQS